MARTRQVAGRVEKTPANHLHASKQRLQTAYNAQIELHTMFEDMVEELRTTREELKAVRKEKADTEAKLKQSMLDAERFAEDYGVWHNLCYDMVGNNVELQEQLEVAQEKVKINADAQDKLEQLRKQWSAISTTLAFEDGKKDAVPTSVRSDDVNVENADLDKGSPPAYTPHG